MSTRLAALLALLLLPGLVACGGGSSGEEDGADTCTPGGTLRRLAYAGGPAPDTAGVFTAFPTSPPMDAAVGGWAAFVGGTTDPTMDVVACAVEPSGATHRVFASGDVIPAPGDGTIDDVLSVRVNGAGRVVAYVTISGDTGGRAFGLLTARVTGGAVSPVVKLVYEGEPVGGLSGVLAAVDHESMVLTGTTGETFFLGTTTTGEQGLFRVSDDGSSLVLLSGTNEPLPGAASVESIEAFCLGPAAQWVAFVCVRQDGGATRGVYAGQIGGVLGEVFEEGDPLANGTADDIPGGQAMAVDTKGVVLFEAVNGAGEDHLCVGAAGFAPTFVAVEGEVEPVWTGAEFEDLAWLRVEPGITLPVFQAQLGPSGSGVTFGLYGVPSLEDPPAIAAYEGRPAPSDLGEDSRLTSVFPGLSVTGRQDVDDENALAFCNVLTSGRPGLFWLVPGCGFFTIAAGGQAAPGGDTFGGGTAWRASTSAGVVVFRAPLVTAGSGIFLRTSD